MGIASCCFSVIKKLSLLIVLLAIAIPLYYGSSNPHHLMVRVIHSIISIRHKFVPDMARPKLSPEYRAFETILQSVPLVTYDPHMDPLARAKQMRASFPFGNIVPRPSTCESKKQIFEYEGQKTVAYWVNNRVGNKSWESDRIMLYFHGGGYLMGDFPNYSGFECELSQRFDLVVIHVEYRRVPEDPLPAAVHDAVTVYRALLSDGLASSRLIVMGDSAGGGLTFLLLQALIANGVPIPRAAITLSPWTDLMSSGESFKRNALSDVLVRPEDVPWIIEQVLGPNRAQIALNDPYHSPLYGSFKGFPPMYITAGTIETLQDDSTRVAEKAQKENVDVTLEMGEYMMHVHPIFFTYFPEADQSLQNIRKWLNEKFQ